MINKGKIIIGAGLNVWPHEMKTAEALASAGYTIEFIPRSNNAYERTADVLIDGVIYEIKSPVSHKKSMIQKNLRRALHQSCNVVFDSRRMKDLPNAVIEQEVRQRSVALRTLKHLIYISRRGEVVLVK